MSRLTAAAAALAAALLAAGCAGLGGERYPDAAELREQGRAQARAGYAYGHGSGATPEQARQSALYEIAGQVVTAVRGEQRAVFRALQRRGELGEGQVEQAAEMALTATVASLSHVAVEGAEVVAERRVRQGWYVRVRVPERRLARMRAEARRKAPALAQFERVEAVPAGEPGRRFVRAVHGLETVERTGVGTARLYSAEAGETTFGAYFRTAIREAARRIQALPVVEGERVRFAVVDRETLQPQPNLAVRTGGWEWATDADGWTAAGAVDGLGAASPVVVVGEPGGRRPPLPASARRSGTLRPGQWRSPEQATLYLHTQPAGAVVAVGGADYTTPARIPVEPGRTYTVRVYGTDAYRGTRIEVRVGPDTPVAYRSVALTERRFGELDLSAAGTGTVICLEDHGVRAPAIQRPAEAGRYRVRVSRGGERYQDIVDALTLRPDERIRRHYAAPRDREPYHYGWRWALSLAALGGEPGDAYAVPGDGGEVPYEALAAEIDAVESASRGALSLQLGVLGQYFADALPVTAAGGLGYRLARFDVTAEGPFGTTREAQVDLGTLQATVGLGLWHPFSAGPAWLTVNRAWERSRWADGEAAVAMPSGRAGNAYTFVELGGQLGPWSVAARLGTGEGGLRPLLLIGLGAAQMTAGYRHPPQVQARPGVHYE